MGNSPTIAAEKRAVQKKEIRPMKYQRVIHICVLCALTARLFAQQKTQKQTSPAAPSSPNSVKLAPPQARQRLLKLVAARKPVTISIPIAVTPAKLKHQDVMLKLEKQKQSVSALRMTLVSAHNGVQPSPAGKGGSGMQGARSSPSMAQRSEITPASNVGLVQQRGSPPGSKTYVSPVVNPNTAAVAVCHGPTISTVNGQVRGALFSTDPSYNDDLIEGCGFGNQKGSVYLSGPFATPMARLNVSYWADTWIDVQMDPYISGELDHGGNVTLVVALPNGQQTQAQGFSFYAVRATTLLAMIPRSQTNLGFIPDASGAYTLSLDFASPSSIPATTLEINRWDAGRFGSANDSFSFNQLSPGFYVDRVEFSHFDMTQADCGSDFYIDGNWTASWDAAANALRVATQEQHCHWPPFGESSFYDYSWSHYAIAVWAVGPRGTNPWAVQK